MTKTKKAVNKQPVRRRVGRRKMAWTALVSMLVATVLIYFVIPNDRLSLIDNVSTWFYTIMGSIVLTYVGAATWFDVRNPKPTITTQESIEEEETDNE